MSIETAPHPLYALITEMSADLDEATAAYCKTGQTLVDTDILRADTVARTANREDIVRVHHDAAIEAGKNEMQRKLLAARLLNDDTMLRGLREDSAKLNETARRTELAHKNAYHEMESLRVRLAALAALVQGGAR